MGAAKGQDLRWSHISLLLLLSLRSLRGHLLLHPVLPQLTIWKLLSNPALSFLIIKRRLSPTFSLRLAAVRWDQGRLSREVGALETTAMEGKGLGVGDIGIWWWAKSKLS